MNGSEFKKLSPDLCQKILAVLPDGLTITDTAGKILQVNQRTLEIFGVRHESDVIGTLVTDWIAPESMEKAKTNMGNLFKGLITADNEYLLRKQDGTLFYGAINASVLHDDQGNVAGMLATTRDLSEKQEILERVRNQKKQIDRYFENSLDLLCIADTGGYFRRLNPEWAKTLGYPLEELVGKQFMEFVHPEDVPDTIQALSDLGSQKEVVNFINRYRCKDGSYRWIEWRSYPEGENIYAVARDITQRKVYELLVEGLNQVMEMIVMGKPLQESMDKLLRIVDSQAPGMLSSILLLDHDGIHVRHGAAPSLPKQYLEAIDGSPIGPQAGSCGTAAYRGEQVLVKDIQTDPLWTEYKDLAAQFDLRACWSTPIFDKQHRVLGTFALYFRETRLPDKFHRWLIGKVTHVASIAISNFRESEALKESERYNRFLFKSSPTGLALCRMDGSLVDVNPAFAAIIGRSVEEAEQLSYWDITPEQYKEQEEVHLESLRTTGSYGPYEKEYIHAGGHLVPVRLFGRIIEQKGEQFIWSSVEDITEQKKAEEGIISLNRKLQTINRIILQTTHSMDLKTRLEIILEEALAVTGLEGGTICLINPDDTFELAAHRETSPETIEDLSSHQVKIGDCLCGNSAKECKPLILNTRKEVLKYATREVLRGEDIRFHAAFPFVTESSCVGVLCVFTRTDKKPEERSLELLETIVAQTAISIQNARLWEEVKANEKELRSIYDTAGDVIFQLAVEPGNTFRFLSVNPSFTRVTGLNPDRIIGKRVEEVIPEPSLTMVLGKYREAIESKGLVKWEETSDYPTGKLTGEVTVAPLFDEEGVCTHLIGSVHDITERKVAEKKIRKQLNELQRWQQVMFGREERNMELKREVNELLKELGRERKYRIDNP